MKSLQSLSYKTLFAILFFSLAGIVFFLKIGGKTQKVSAAWWNDMWHYRKAISIGNSGTATTNQYIKITLDTASLITANKMQPDCDDIRVTNINGNLLTHFIDGNSSYACNTSTTSIYVLADSIPSSGSTIYLYYGNLSATNVEPQLGTQQNPAISCKNILQHRSDNKGTQQYYITPTGNLANSIQITCDMTYSSGGWIQVWHGLPSEAFANDSTHETINLSNNIIFNEMRVEGTNLNFNVVDTVTQTAMLGSSIRTYFNQVHNAPDTPSPKVAFHNLSGTQSINLTNNYFLYGYGNDYRVFYTCINVEGINYLYLGGYSPTCTPRSSFASAELGCTGSGNYCNNSRNTTPTDSGLHLSLYQYQESSVYVRETAITLNINQSMGTIAAEETGGSPIAYWKFDEGVGTTAYDSVGNNNGNIVGNTTYVDEGQCISGKCLNFDGSGDHIYPGAKPALNNLESFTLSAWINMRSRKYIPTIINKGPETAAQHIWWGINSNNTIWLELGDTSSHTNYGSNTLSWDTNKWYFLAATVNNQTKEVKHYRDGVLVRTLSFSGRNFNSGTYETSIGRYYTNRAASYDWDGYLDEVKIYPYARTADQIKLDYNSRGSLSGSSANLGVQSNTAPSIKTKIAAHWKLDETNGSTIKDSSGNNFIGTLGSGNSSPTWSTNGKFNSALSFDGNDSITLSNEIVSTSSIRTNGITYSAWVKPTTVSGIQKIFGQKPSSGYSDLASGGIDISSGNARMIAYDDNIAYKYATGNTTLNPNQWYLITGVYNPSDQKIKIYVNGKFDGGETSITTFSRLLANDYNLVGSHNYSSSFFNGLIDELKIYNYALTPEEVKQDYNAGSAIQFGQTTQNIGGTTTSLDYCIPGDASTCSAPVAEWNFEENTGTTVKDTSGNNNNGTFGTGSSAPTWTVGANNKGTGLNFDGSNDYISISTYAYTTNATISVWVKGSYVNGNQIIVGSPNSISLGIYNVGSSKAIIGSAGISKSVGIANNFINDSWNHLTVVFDNSGNATYYCNGQLLSNSGTNSWTWSSGAYIGRRDSGTYFKGQIDQLKIYNYARTPAQIAYDYNKGAPVGWWKMDECQGSTINDSSGNNNIGTLSIGQSGTQNSIGTCQIGTSAAWTNGASGHTNSSLNFDGTDDYITIPTITFTDSQPWSFSSWIKHNNTNTTFYAGKNSSEEGFLNYLSGDFAFRDKNTTYYHFTPSTPYANQFTHIIWVADGNNNLSLYINGKLEKTTSSIPTQMHFEMIGRGYDSNGYNFKGQIDDVRIYNYALTSEQVKQVYNGGAVNFN